MEWGPILATVGGVVGGLVTGLGAAQKADPDKFLKEKLWPVLLRSTVVGGAMAFLVYNGIGLSGALGATLTALMKSSLFASGVTGVAVGLTCQQFLENLIQKLGLSQSQVNAMKEDANKIAQLPSGSAPGGDAGGVLGQAAFAVQTAEGTAKGPTPAPASPSAAEIAKRMQQVAEAKNHSELRRVLAKK